MIKTLKKTIEPLHVLSNQAVLILIASQAVIALLAWQMAGGGLIPTPTKVLASTIAILGTANFYDNFFSSIALSFKGMGISLVVAIVVSYMSLVPLFSPISKFIIKCRYLTLTGLIFLFTLLTQDGSQLKISLLIFGIVPFFVTSLMSIIDTINVQEYELCKTLRMNNWQTLWEVVIIGRLDQVIEVMRQNFAISWMMITMVEGLSMSEGGLGTMLIKSNKYIDLGTVFAILLIIFLTGIFFDFILGQIRYWLFPYTKLQIRK
jgi:ABC-type nitrate/sulfonate/bicarbonate transport system permease component